MTTATDIINQSLRLLGVLATDSSETTTAGEAADCLLRMNDMLDSWSTENIATYVRLTQSFPLVAGTSSYTIGPTGTIVATRPMTILPTPYVRDFNGNDYPLVILNNEEWDRIGTKYNVNADIPDAIHYDPGYPNGTMIIWPQPTIAYTLFFECDAQLATLAVLSTPIVFPPGYQRAITYNLALEIHGMFPERDLPPSVVQIARDSKANIKRINQQSMDVRFDPALRQRNPTYNIHRG
jgi:hypothetical protein